MSKSRQTPPRRRNPKKAFTLLSQDPGFRLKNIREKLGLTQEAIQKASSRIARVEANPQFAICHSHLSVIENSNSLPNIFKLFSLCAIYRLNLNEVLRWYGLTNERLVHLYSQASIEVTHRLPVSFGANPGRKTALLPDPSDPLLLDKTHTTLLTRLEKTWKEVPLGLLAGLDLRDRAYAFIGRRDFVMYPLLKPGSIVQIDVHRNTISREGWKCELDRPIYLLELRARYVCCWCSLVGKLLHLVPHPLSPCKPETVSYPEEVDVVGQVVGVTMWLGECER